jgi:group I intron endonuclease
MDDLIWDNTPGVYLITSLRSGNNYVGSAIELLKRRKTHLWALGLGRHHSQYLQRHYDKYGVDDLEFSILEKFSFISKEHLLSREQYYIDTIEPKFNSAKIAGSCLGIKHTEETRLKISIATRGRKKSKETIERMKVAQKINQNLPWSKDRWERRRNDPNVVYPDNSGSKHPNWGKKGPLNPLWRKPHTPEHNAKIGHSHIGLHLSDEAKRKLREFHIGRPPGNKGVPMTPEQLAKLKISQKIRRDREKLEKQNKINHNNET